MKVVQCGSFCCSTRPFDAELSIILVTRRKLLISHRAYVKIFLQTKRFTFTLGTDEELT